MGAINHEPTMEDILASIKKIIADDGEAVMAGPDARSQRRRPDPEPEIEDVLELTDKVETEALTDEVTETEAEPTEESIASEESVQPGQVALAAMPAIANPATPQGETDDAHPLEGLVREMLRPMLKEWLDDNLPGMIEDMVAREIARIATPGE